MMIGFVVVSKILPSVSKNWKVKWKVSVCTGGFLRNKEIGSPTISGDALIHELRLSKSRADPVEEFEVKLDIISESGSNILLVDTWINLLFISKTCHTIVT